MDLDILFWGISFGVVGKVILGISVISVHWRVVKEHKIDGAVLKEMKRERNLAILGIIFIVVGYFLEVSSLNYFPFT